MPKDYEIPQNNGNDSVCVTTPTGRSKEIGVVARDSRNSASAGKCILGVVCFLKKFKDCNGNYEESKQLIDDVLQKVINHNFEVWLVADYYMYKTYPETQVIDCYNIKILIEEFVATVGLIKFSEYFQAEWTKLQPITYHFGFKEFKIGKDPDGPIDILLDLLDELDERNSKLGDKESPPGYHTALIRTVLGDKWSYSTLTLNELIRMSGDVKRKAKSSGCEFVRKLVERIGLENLSLKTKELYVEVFLPN